MSDPTLVKTLQAPPLGMAGPKLTAYVGDNSIIGVRITWAPPRRPNGLITHFELFRRNYTAVGGGEWLSFRVIESVFFLCSFVI